MHRRTFIRNTSAVAAGAGLAPGFAFSHQNLSSPRQFAQNKLPKWKGFNLLDFFSPDPAKGRKATTEEQLKWMADWGFDFVRIPMAYPAYLKFDRSRDITPEEVYQIDE